VTAPPEIAGLSHAELEQLVLKLLSESAEQKRMIAELREEIARLKGLKGRPQIKPSGMEAGTTPKPPGQRAARRGRGKVVPKVGVEEQILPALASKATRTLCCRIWCCGRGSSAIAGNAGSRRTDGR
jgi:hypothetical protein